MRERWLINRKDENSGNYFNSRTGGSWIIRILGPGARHISLWRHLLFWPTSDAPEMWGRFIIAVMFTNYWVVEGGMWTEEIIFYCDLDQLLYFNKVFLLPEVRKIISFPTRNFIRKRFFAFSCKLSEIWNNM